MKTGFKMFSLLLAFIAAPAASGMARDSLTINKCHELAQKNYPLIKQRDLIEKTLEYTLENASKGYLPHIVINGQATYQSDVTRIPVSIPNLDVPVLTKDQYKIYAELNQPLTDAAVIRQQKEYIRRNAGAESQKIEIEMYRLRERVNQLFFGILLIDAQNGLNEILKSNLSSGLKKTQAAIAGGVAIQSNADMLSAEILKAKQRETELRATRRGFADMLTQICGREVNENTILVMPEKQALSADFRRPELQLFENQRQIIATQSKLLDVKNTPRANLFLQAGYGKPALNFLKNEFEFYYIGGLRLSWNISGYYTSRNERQLLSLNSSAIDIQKELFLFNSGIQLRQQNSEIGKLEELMATDLEIVTLRENIRKAANAQLENGTITQDDYLNYLNAEDQARQNLAVHKVQLLLAQFNHKVTTGN